MSVSLKSIAVFAIAMAFSLNARGQALNGGNCDSKVLWREISQFFSPPAKYKDQYGNYRSPLKFYDGKTAKTPEEWKKRRKEILNRWMEMMGKWPPFIENQEMQILSSKRRDGFTQFRVSFYWLPDQKTVGYLLVPDGDGKKPAVIVVFYTPDAAIAKHDKKNRNFAYELVKRGFITLSLGTTATTEAKTYSLYYPNIQHSTVQPLSVLAYAAANAWYALSKYPRVDSSRIGIMGFSYGGKWAMFASCLFDKFACAVWDDPGLVFSDSHPPLINYWEPWYLGYYPPPWHDTWRNKGMVPGAKGLYPKLIRGGYDLQELQALMAPRPFMVSGGLADGPKRWTVLNYTVAVDKLLGYNDRVAFSHERDGHLPTRKANRDIYRFFGYFLECKSTLSKTK